MAVYAICVGEYEIFRAMYTGPSTAIVNSMVELYPLTLLLNEYVPVPGSSHENMVQENPIRRIVENHLLKSWFATSLMTNFLVTISIIWRIISQLPTYRCAPLIRFDLPVANASADGQDNGFRSNSREGRRGVRSRCCALLTWTPQLWPKRKNGDGWQWQSLYTRVVVILIEAALPPALCGIASMITFFSGDTVMTKQWQRDGRDWSREVVVRLFMTLWLGTSVCFPISIVRGFTY